MKGASKVIMGATLVMVVSFAIVLGLILVLLAELYCSLLLRRRRQFKHPATSGSTITNTAAAAITTPTNTTSSFSSHDSQDESTSPLSSFYAQGVLQAPRNFLFPAVIPCKQNKVGKDSHLALLHHVIEFHAQESNTSRHQIGILSPTTPSTSIATSPNPVQEISVQVGTGSTTTCNGKAFSASGPGVENLVYISNPIYDNDAGRPETPPFETPDTSPSRLENSGSSGDDEKALPSDHVRLGLYSLPMTPPLSPMKKLPAQAPCSVSLRDVRSLGISGSDSICNNGVSSSSSGSPCTSPSW